MTNTTYVLQTRYLGIDDWVNNVFVGKDVHEAEAKALAALRAEIWEVINDDEEHNEHSVWTESQRNSLDSLTTLYELIEWVREHMEDSLQRCGWHVS